MPLDVRHRLDDGTTRDHRAIHNVYGMENVRATYDGLRNLQPDERPFVLTRAAYSGTQRYAATWTGDNSSTWNHLNMSTPMLLSLGLCGYTMVGDDIGGFAGSPPPRLLSPAGSSGPRSIPFTGITPRKARATRIRGSTAFSTKPFDAATSSCVTSCF